MLKAQFAEQQDRHNNAVKGEEGTAMNHCEHCMHYTASRTAPHRATPHQYTTSKGFMFHTTYHTTPHPTSTPPQVRVHMVFGGNRSLNGRCGAYLGGFEGF